MSCRKKKKRSTELVAALLILALILAVAGVVFVKNQYDQIRYPLAYEDLILKYAAENGLDTCFVAAVINNESSFNPRAKSDADAYGLMQIQSDTFDWIKAKIGETRDLQFEDLSDPELSIQYGCALYGLLYREFGDLKTAIAAYHAGRGQVKKWLSQAEYSKDGLHLEKIPFADTNHYVQRILSDLKVYAKRYPILSQNQSA